MHATRTPSGGFRRPDRWNSVPIPAHVAERAHERHVEDENGCWISTYSVGSHGYAQIGWQIGDSRHMVLAHKAAWVHEHGQVPLSMTLDHECKVHTCVRPAHLRLLPNFENARRVNGRDWPMGECANGHSNESLGDYDRGGRVGLICLDCRKLYVARSNWRRRHPGVPLPPHLLLQVEREALAS